MIFNKIYEKLDRSLTEIHNLKALSGREHHENVCSLTDISDSVDFLNKEVVAIRQDVTLLHQTINDLKNTLTPK